jgi:hypothetical protein
MQLCKTLVLIAHSIYMVSLLSPSLRLYPLATIILTWILRDLQMPSMNNKFAVFTFLSLPLTVITIGCSRLYTFIAVFSLLKLLVEDPFNVRNALSKNESNLAVISACGPHSRMYFRPIHSLLRHLPLTPCLHSKLIVALSESLERQ